MFPILIFCSGGQKVKTIFPVILSIAMNLLACLVFTILDEQAFSIWEHILEDKQSNMSN